jgi:hypothetical protein
MGEGRYDSRLDTYEHIERVREWLHRVTLALLRRAKRHDASKLAEPERAMFDEFTPKLAASTYGSGEYEGFREAMGEALRHHYECNSHHPEHYEDGIAGMSLLDLIEMLCDWYAATERHEDGDILRSIEQNQGRFGYSDELKSILLNTIHELDGLGA